MLLFTHAGWREPVEFMDHCSTKWASFLLGLKARLEAGDGTPFPTTSISSLGLTRADASMDDVFKALADPSRRRLLDSLNARGGQNLSDLCAGLDMARQSVTKHLAILEAADLVVTSGAGGSACTTSTPRRSTRSPTDGSTTTTKTGSTPSADLKNALEEHTDETHRRSSTRPTSRPRPSSCGKGSPSRRSRKRYWGIEFVTDWKVGSTMTWDHHGVTIDDPEQVVLEYDPYRRLAYTWHTFTPELAAEFGFDEELRPSSPPSAGRRWRSRSRTSATPSSSSP